MATLTDTVTHLEPRSDGLSSLRESLHAPSVSLAPTEPFDTIIEPTPETHAAEAETPYPTGAKFWLIILSLSLALLLEGLDNSIVATAIPSITQEFHTVTDIGWYSTAYRLCTCSFQFFFGKLYTLYPTKRVFLVSVSVYLLGSVFCATAWTSPIFVLGRAVTGVGASGLLAGAFALLIKIVPLRRRPVFSASLACVEAVAEICAPVLGGILTQELSWRWCFWINLPLCVFTLTITAIFFTEPPSRDETVRSWRDKLARLDLLGTVVFLPSMTCLFTALSWAGTKYPWYNPGVICLFIGFALLLAAFVYDQYRRGDDATLPLRIVGNRNVLAGALFSMCMNGGLNVLIYYLPTWFQIVRNESPAQSGWLVLPIIAGFAIAMLVHGAATTALGYYTPLMLLGSILSPIAVGLITTWKVHTGLVRVLVYSCLAGIAGGIGFQGPQSAVQTVLPASDASMGLAVIIFSQHFGPAVFIAIAQTVLLNRLVVNLHDVSPGLDSKGIESIGLTDLKSAVGPDKLALALESVNHSMIQTWYLALALACVTGVGSVLTQWKSVKKRRD